MYFRVYSNVKEIEAPDIETAEQILKDSLKEIIWLLPVTETPVAPPAREPGRPDVKEKKGGHGSMTARR
ncbi:MAG: hypothetical protein JRG79_08730 [Deltaproteobacteria bacterium]|nr:hypothetical protein [Deltaproteobacteria bacterium]MBW1862630.1 hypothetical protein [Deltaproteobacteria bacterium]MBW2206983.1 hypothetical protein [Deltaproteobacteria bacterium]